VSLSGVIDCATYDPVADAFHAHVTAPRSLAPGRYALDVRVLVDGTLAASGSRNVAIIG
jgi:hypothetical protein